VKRHLYLVPPPSSTTERWPHLARAMKLAAAALVSIFGAAVVFTDIL
jgi:hypothetical protein